MTTNPDEHPTLVDAPCWTPPEEVAHAVNRTGTWHAIPDAQIVAALRADAHATAEHPTLEEGSAA